jgi:SNF2 family DNA or RNA helicase
MIVGCFTGIYCKGCSLNRRLMFFSTCFWHCIQAVAFLAVLRHLDGDPGPHLLVAPASLLENWERELKKWCPSFSVLLYHGAQRAVLRERLRKVAKAKLPAPFNVMLTCYSLFERQRLVIVMMPRFLIFSLVCPQTCFSHSLHITHSLNYEGSLKVVEL